MAQKKVHLLDPLRPCTYTACGRPLTLETAAVHRITGWRALVTCKQCPDYPQGFSKPRKGKKRG